MSRIDLSETEADFLAFEFASEDDATAARACFPSDVVVSGPTTLQYRTNEHVEDARERMGKVGLSWTETESTLTEGDMWPEWPEDGGHPDDAGEGPSLPTP